MDTATSPIVIRQTSDGQVWVKIVAVISMIAAIVFAFLWCTSNNSSNKEVSSDIEGGNKSGSTLINKKINGKPLKKINMTKPEESDSEDDIEFDPDLKPNNNNRMTGVPPFTAPNPMMPNMHRDLPPIGGTGQFPVGGNGGPPPPIRCGREAEDYGDRGMVGGGGDGGPRPYGGSKTGRGGKGVRIKF